MEGRKVHLPVFLARRPEEEVDEDLSAFYRRLLAAIGDDVFRRGTWRLAETRGWPGDDHLQERMMGTHVYAEVGDGAVVNRVLVDDSDAGAEFAEEQGWVGPVDTLDPEPQIGWVYVPKGRPPFKPPPEAKEPAQLEKAEPAEPQLTAEQWRAVLHEAEERLAELEADK